jgi:hypothetical protein
MLIEQPVLQAARLPVSNRRITQRVEFGAHLGMRMVALDGSWSRSCSIDNVSETGARLTVNEKFDSLDLREFWLFLAQNGKARRRCCKVWQDAHRIGVHFLKPVAAVENETNAPANAVAKPVLTSN